MKLRANLVLIISLFLLVIGAKSVFSQNEGASALPAASKEASSEPEILWVWGEVTAVDSASNKLSVKYLDYENDVEREISISLDDKTTFDNNAGSIAQLKPKDTVSIDYMVDPSGANIAKNISIEKIEAMPGEEMAPEAAPEAAKEETAVPVEAAPKTD